MAEDSFRRHLNDSFYPPDRIWVHIPYVDMVVKSITFGCVTIFGLFSNYMIVRLILLSRNLQTPIYIVIGNMATSNLMTLLFCPVLFLMGDFYQNYILGPLGCAFDNLLTPAFLTTSVLNLCVISYERLTAIAFPKSKRLTMNGAKIIILVTWILGFTVTTPLAIYRDYKVRRWINYVEAYCLEDKLLALYWYILISVMVWVPLAILIICFTIIFYKLDRFEKRLLRQENPIIVSYKWVVAKNLFITILIFIIMRLPYTIMVLLHHTTNEFVSQGASGIYNICWCLAQFLMYANTSINPIIYGYTNENFRRAYKQKPLCYCFRSTSAVATTTNTNRALNAVA